MLTLRSLTKALRTNKVKISPHAEIRKTERDIPIYSILHALPRAVVFARVMTDKQDETATRLCLDIEVNNKLYTLVFGDVDRVITLITGYRDRIHVSYEDEHYSLGDVIRKAG